MTTMECDEVPFTSRIFVAHGIGGFSYLTAKYSVPKRDEARFSLNLQTFFGPRYQDVCLSKAEGRFAFDAPAIAAGVPWTYLPLNMRPRVCRLIFCLNLRKFLSS